MRRLGCAGLMMMLLLGVLLAAVSPVAVAATARRGNRRAPYPSQGASSSVQTALCFARGLNEDRSSASLMLPAAIVASCLITADATFFFWFQRW